MHELVPRDGVLHSPADVAALLAREFAYVHADPDEGKRRLHALAARFEPLGVRRLGSMTLDWPAIAARMRGLKHGEALVIRFGDDAEDALEFLLWLGENVKLDFAGPAEEAAAQPLVERCARALKAEVVLV